MEDNQKTPTVSPLMCGLVLKPGYHKRCPAAPEHLHEMGTVRSGLPKQLLCLGALCLPAKLTIESSEQGSVYCMGLVFLLWAGLAPRVKSPLTAKENNDFFLQPVFLCLEI